MPKSLAVKSDKRIAEMRETFVEEAEKLWKKHQTRFMAVLDDAESKKVKLTYSVTLDFSESTALLDVQIGFSETYRDKVSQSFDDPSQPKLPGMGKATATKENED